MAVKDLGPGGNDGVATSITASDIVVGQHGDAKAISMGGAEYVTVPYSADMNPSDGIFTYAAWVNLDSVSGLKTIFDNYVGASNSGVLVEIVNDILTIQTNSSGAAYSQTLFTNDANKWMFLTFVFDGSFVSVYKNGEIQTGSPSAYTYSQNTSTDLKIGTRVTPAEYFVGDMSEVYFFNSALNQLETRDLYEQTRLASKSTSRINNPAYLKAYLPLNSHTDDVSGNGNNGTPTSLSYVDGMFGRTVGDFNGSSSKVSKQLDITGYSQITVSAWVNPDAIVSSSRIVSILHSGSDDIRLLVSSSEIRFTMDDGTATGTTGDTLEAGKPVFVTGVYDGSHVRVYYNGALNSTASLGSFDFAGADGTLTIGGLPSSAFLDGKIWNVRVYNTALTGEEIQQIYKQEQFVPKPLPASQPYSALPDITDSSLVGAYLNSATNGTAKDYSNNNNDGTATDVVLGDNQGEFNVVSSFIDLNDPFTEISSSTTKTVVATVKSDVTSYVGGRSRIFSLSRTDTATAFMLEVGTNDNWKVSYISDGITFKELDSSIALTTQYIRLVGVQDGTSVHIYINGELAASATDASAPTLSSPVNAYIGAYNNNGVAQQIFDGIIKDVEIYSEAKDASWVSQDYAKRVPDSNLLLHLKNGDKDLSRYNRTLTNTATIIGDGMVFDGADSKIDTGSDWIGTDDFSVIGWVNLSSFGESTLGRMLGNNKYVFALFGSRLLLNSDGATNARGDTILSLDQWIHVSATRTSTGVCNLYVNGLLDGDANQDSGTPEVGSSNVFVGNNSAGSRTFDGKIDDLRAYNRILTASEINAHYLQTRGQY